MSARSLWMTAHLTDSLLRSVLRPRHDGCLSRLSGVLNRTSGRPPIVTLSAAGFAQPDRAGFRIDAHHSQRKSSTALADGLSVWV